MFLLLLLFCNLYATLVSMRDFKKNNNNRNKNLTAPKLLNSTVSVKTFKTKT